jgi:hypothetical protein
MFFKLIIGKDRGSGFFFMPNSTLGECRIKNTLIGSVFGPLRGGSPGNQKSPYGE